MITIAIDNTGRTAIPLSILYFFLLLTPLILTGGMIVFATDLLYLSFHCKGRLDVLLVGPHRAAETA